MVLEKKGERKKKMRTIHRGRKNREKERNVRERSRNERHNCVCKKHRRRIKTEEKAKVVAYVRGKNLLNSLPRKIFCLE